MNGQIRDFFRVEGAEEPHFQQVRFLHEEPEAKWEELSSCGLPRGWFELSRISREDRVEFTKEFWLGVLPFHPIATELIREFFNRLDDIGIVLCRQTMEEPWRSELVYSLGDNSSFFRGLPGARDGEVDAAGKKLRCTLPRDYRSFFKLHNGFGKLTELGILPLKNLDKERNRLIDLIIRSEKALRMGEEVIDPHCLYPFFEEYGSGCQCFISEWYPGSEMGNVYFSEIDYILSDTKDRKAWAEHLAYPTFIEWLAAFLGGANVAL